MKIRYREDGTIEAIGTEIDGREIDESTLPSDFTSTFSLGKYTASEDGNGDLVITEDPNFVMPERQEYTLAEVQDMSVEELLELQIKLQTIIDAKQV